MSARVRVRARARARVCKVFYSKYVMQRRALCASVFPKSILSRMHSMVDMCVCVSV